MATTAAIPDTVKFRVSFFLNYANRGWSETYWKDASNIGGLITNIQSYVTARMGMQPVDVQLGGVRVSVEGQSRKMRTFFAGFNLGDDTYSGFGLIGRGQFGAGSGVTWDLGQQAIQTEVLVAGRRLGFRYVAILPDAVSKTEPSELDFNAIPLWTAAWLRWKKQVLDDKWQVRITQATADRAEYPIQGWIIGTDPAADSQLVLSPVTSLPGVDVGKKVVVRAARMKYSGVRSPNGTWFVKKVVADNPSNTVTVTLEGSAGLNLKYLASKGVVYLGGVQYITPSALAPYSVTKHKRGAPFPRSVGRRSKPRFPPS